MVMLFEPRSIFGCTLIVSPLIYQSKDQMVKITMRKTYLWHLLTENSYGKRFFIRKSKTTTTTLANKCQALHYAAKVCRSQWRKNIWSQNNFHTYSNSRFIFSVSLPRFHTKIIKLKNLLIDNLNKVIKNTVCFKDFFPGKNRFKKEISPDHMSFFVNFSILWYFVFWVMLWGSRQESFTILVFEQLLTHVLIGVLLTVIGFWSSHCYICFVSCA